MAEPLPPEVMATLRALLAGRDPVSGALPAQVPHTRVSGRCGCGCATVDLEVDSKRSLEIHSVSDEPISRWPDPHFFDL
ncbi:hypothetical protein ACFYR1_13910 [Streptomyces canus]|uniref:hypothetical protein n=1 Tax=Streptomyces canus TaxID=58343 RepID=UPI0036AAFAC6